ncbi:MAG: hypothetical protein ACK40G_15890 [Cytophagaceae bacterium]
MLSINKNRIFQIGLILSAVFLLSCSRGVVVNRNYQGKPLDADFSVRLYWSDFVYIGEVTGTVSYTEYLGGIRVYDDARYNNYSLRTVMTFNGRNFMPIGGRSIQRALYDATEQYPDMEFLIPTQIKTEVNSMFLGRKVTQTVKAKAYKLK